MRSQKTTTRRRSDSDLKKSGSAAKRLASKQGHRDTKCWYCGQVVGEPHLITCKYFGLSDRNALNAFNDAHTALNALASVRVSPVKESVPTPFERVRDAAHDVLQLELRVAQFSDKLLGPSPMSGETSASANSAVSAPIFELNEHASDITAAVRRMHELLDRFNPVLPS